MYHGIAAPEKDCSLFHDNHAFGALLAALATLADDIAVAKGGTG